MRPSQLLVLLLATLLTCAAHAQCPGQWLPGMGVPGVDGTVAAVVGWDPDGSGPTEPRLVVGGEFALAGTTLVQNIAVWDGESWSRPGQPAG